MEEGPMRGMPRPHSGSGLVPEGGTDTDAFAQIRPSQTLHRTTPWQRPEKLHVLLLHHLLTSSRCTLLVRVSNATMHPVPLRLALER